MSQCYALTQQGTRCTKNCLEGTLYCGVHLKKRTDQHGGEKHDAELSRLSQLIERLDFDYEHVNDPDQIEIKAAIVDIVNIAMTSKDGSFMFNVYHLLESMMDDIEDNGSDHMMELLLEVAIQQDDEALRELGEIYGGDGVSPKNLGENIVIYEVQLRDLQAQILQLQQENISLKEKVTQLQFAPGGEGYQETKHHFESLKETKKRSKKS